MNSVCPSVWMSATLEPEWLDTIDFRGNFTGAPLELTEADYNRKLPLHKRMTAAKTLQKLNVTATDAKAFARTVVEQHQAETQTLVIVNTVDRAKDVYAELLKQRKKSSTPALLLIHSRFRPEERKKLNDALQDKSPGDRIIVATQVVEAGMDISSRTLITELAPWASIVQRIGRCNRTGDDGNTNDPARVFWIDLPEKSALPYSDGDLDFARTQLAKLEGKDVSPKALADFKKVENITLPFEHKHVLRRRDLLDLFDTTPDLSGNDIDIQRFVRSDDPDTDVQVFWRDVSGSPGDQPSPERRELCSVPVGHFRKFIEGKGGANAFVWDHLEDRWIQLEPKQVRPGLVILLPASAGGYSAELGWSATSNAVVDPIASTSDVSEEGVGSDPTSASPVALTIAQHTNNVIVELRAILKALRLDDLLQVFEPAARWHDVVGKAKKSSKKADAETATEEASAPATEKEPDDVAGVVNLRRLAKACFKYDPNSLIHGIFLEKIAGRLRHPRALSAFIEASGVGRADSGGVKFDRVLPKPSVAGVDAKGGYGNVPFHRTEFTAKSISAYFSIDLAQIRGYGLPDDATKLLVALSLWKVRQFLDSNMRLRTACELELKEGEKSIVVKRPAGFILPATKDFGNSISELIGQCKSLFVNPAVTELTWNNSK